MASSMVTIASWDPAVVSRAVDLVIAELLLEVRSVSPAIAKAYSIFQFHLFRQVTSVIYGGNAQG